MVEHLSMPSMHKARVQSSNTTKRNKETTKSHLFVPIPYHCCAISLLIAFTSLPILSLTHPNLASILIYHYLLKQSPNIAKAKWTFSYPYFSAAFYEGDHSLFLEG